MTQTDLDAETKKKTTSNKKYKLFPQLCKNIISVLRYGNKQQSEYVIE